MKVLQFLQIGGMTGYNEYLQHITELFHVKLTHDMTHSDMFEELQKMFPNNPEKQQAINNWVKLNKENQKDPSFLDQKVLSEDDNKELNWYAAFNLWDKK